MTDGTIWAFISFSFVSLRGICFHMSSDYRIERHYMTLIFITWQMHGRCIDDIEEDTSVRFTRNDTTGAGLDGLS